MERSLRASLLLRRIRSVPCSCFRTFSALRKNAALTDSIVRALGSPEVAFFNSGVPLRKRLPRVSPLQLPDELQQTPAQTSWAHLGHC